MTTRDQRSEVRGQKPESGSRSRATRWWLLLAVLVCATPGRGADLAALCADRTAIEHVYYEHRLGTKPPFEQISPATLIERLVREDLRKKAALKKAYGVAITPALVEAEVQRINATTRAPDVLAEIKAALGGDPARFARAFARPIVVERTLCARFENDDVLHAPRRALTAQARARLLVAKDSAAALLRNTKDGQVAETTWQLISRPAEAAAAAAAAPPTLTKVSAQSGAYAIEAAAQLAQVLNPSAAADPKFYFEDLDPGPQKVLLAQLQKPGDVSAVIETPGGFLVFLAQEKTATTLRVTSLSLPKRSYEEWLAQQPEDQS